VYEIFCLSCGKVFDACRAAWCECITDNPTLVCPFCGQCFCSATPEARKSFWEAAPPELWRRRLRAFAQEQGDPPSELGNPLRRPLVLVADDEPDTRRIAFRVLEALGYGVLLASDGEQALALAKTYLPDLILTDHMMPRMDGKHLSLAVKEDPSLAHIRVVLMSGLYKKDSQRIAALRDFKADDYLTKPIAFDRLAEVLASWLAPAEAR
jgi:CheY-like chemotaxis protein